MKAALAFPSGAAFGCGCSEMVAVDLPSGCEGRWIGEKGEEKSREKCGGWGMPIGFAKGEGINIMIIRREGGIEGFRLWNF